MKKILLTFVVLIGFMLPTQSEEKGLATVEFARQTGELVGQAQVCGIDTSDVDHQLIQSITILATYRKEPSDGALKTYKSTIQRQLSSSSSLDCSQIQSDFSQVQRQLSKSLDQ